MSMHEQMQFMRLQRGCQQPQGATESSSSLARVRSSAAVGGDSQQGDLDQVQLQGSHARFPTVSCRRAAEPSPSVMGQLGSPP